MTDKLELIMDFFHEAETLKKLLRHCWLSDGRQESVAEHTWRMALIAMILEKEIKTKVDIAKVLKMILIHDLAEIKAGDHHEWKGELKNKHQIEKKALIEVTSRLPGKTKDEVIALWEEFEENKTNEAKFARALDKLEVLLQHNEADLSTWEEKEYAFNLKCGIEECEFDSVLKAFREIVQEEIKEKIK